MAGLFGLGSAATVCQQRCTFGPHGEVGCLCPTCVVWHRFTSGKLFGMRVYEVVTAELVHGLAELVWARARSRPATTVLEVGAGNGRLGFFLSRRLSAASPCRCSLLPADMIAKGQGSQPGCSTAASREGALSREGLGGEGMEGRGRSVTIVCTDSSARGLAAECAQAGGTRFAVEELTCEDALRKYCPQMVLVCWMELGVDWTAAIRQARSVEEYVLVGEPDSGVCGRRWETWGIAEGPLSTSSSSSSSSSLSPRPASSPPGPAAKRARLVCAEEEDEGLQECLPSPPYASDGFRRVDVPALQEVRVRHPAQMATDTHGNCHCAPCAFL